MTALHVTRVLSPRTGNTFVCACVEEKPTRPTFLYVAGKTAPARRLGQVGLAELETRNF